MTKGHYTADAVHDPKDGTGPQWFRFDDEHVTEETLANILDGPETQESVFMLLYTLAEYN
jgi:ubiquitin C-terminal hydrolase